MPTPMVKLLGSSSDSDNEDDIFEVDDEKPDSTQKSVIVADVHNSDAGWSDVLAFTQPPQKM